MTITRQSALTGNISTMEIDVTIEQIEKWKGGTVIQRAMPNLSADEREFIKTGITAEEWDSMGE